jgi:ribonuclease HII
VELRSLGLAGIELELRALGFLVVCGVDEAGRGPLAGPVYAAAVVLPDDAYLPGLDDSKKLSPRLREFLYDEIAKKAFAFGVASASHAEVDDLNILHATFLAMNRAVGQLPFVPELALVDGNRDPGLCCRSICLVGGDGRSESIAAASILAKVSRDRYMEEMARKYPEYGFERHKGYGTRLHYERLREHGPSEIHRKSFLRRMES